MADSKAKFVIHKTAKYLKQIKKLVLGYYI